MAITSVVTGTKDTQLANRYGLNTALYDYAEYQEGTSQPVLSIDFVNISEIAISGDMVWATGGQAHGNKIGFNNPMTGTFKLSTQLMTNQLLALCAGQDIATTDKEVVFANTADGVTPKYFIIKSETVWQAEDGSKFSEDLTFCKALAKRALNITYNGEGDPVSVDIEFELAENDKGEILKIVRDSVEAGE